MSADLRVVKRVIVENGMRYTRRYNEVSLLIAFHIESGGTEEEVLFPVFRGNSEITSSSLNVCDLDSHKSIVFQSFC